jgi:NTE family protein
MPEVTLRKTHRALGRPPFDCVALVLQGGGALGAYQAGVYQAMAEADLPPDWVAGISIGAINAAIIAGNPPEARVAQLQAFWEAITAPTGPWGWANDWVLDGTAFGEAGRVAMNHANALLALAAGASGFFAPRIPAPYFHPLGSPHATSFYDTGALRATLLRFIDFDRINDPGVGPRLSLGAVNLRTGNFVYFDTTTHRILPEHVMASGALPPGFAAVEIDGEYYWDGGLVSNTPLSWVVSSEPRMDTLAFQVDLWSARGELPRDLGEVAMRQKEIQYSSRTRANTDHFKRLHRMRAALADLLDKLPPELRQSPEAALLAEAASREVFKIVHLIYRSRAYEGQSKDYEFSRVSMQEHWQSGYLEAVRTLRHPEVVRKPPPGTGVTTFDLARDGRE